MKIFTDEEMEQIIGILDPKDSEYGTTYEIYPEDKLSKCGVFVPDLVENVKYYKAQLTSHSPEGHNYTNKQYVSCLLENEELKKRLSKYENVINRVKSYTYAMRDDYSDDIDRATKRLALYLAIDTLEG